MAKQLKVSGQTPTEAGAQNVSLCRYTPSGLSVTIKFDDIAKPLNVRVQTATEAGAQNATFCNNTHQLPKRSHKMTHCAVIRLLALV